MTTAAIEGVVSDESGGIIPDVTVTATHVDTGATRTAITDDRGRYSLPNLRVGPYEVRTELPGFTTQIRRGIHPLPNGQEFNDGRAELVRSPDS
ncbi:MAG: carboxypeptidase regulatory-like domain-containing protein [Acidobacteria bacterium]|nr:carboxypeptidase regulatory-like domain-containing protein [Acidobacteriota bacterium]